MASSSNKYPFFENLRTVASTVSNNIREIERKMQNSKFELPENNAIIKLTQLCDDVKAHKSDSQAFFQQLCGENQKYVCYRQDIELLVDEMEKSVDRVEELLIGYGYRKWHPECMFTGDCKQFSSNIDNGTPLKESLPNVRKLAVESEQQPTLEKTPVLADYGLTAKIPKYLPSALKDKQESVMKSTKKQVHFESPEGVSDFKGKENRVPYSLQKTPLLEDYGLPSRTRNLHVSHTKDTLRIKKQLNFQSPLGSVSNTITKSPASLPHSDVDNTDDFRELVNSLNSGFEKVHVAVPKLQSDTKLSTPEEPLLLCSQRLKFASKRQNENVTPEEPEIQPVRVLGTAKITGSNGGTPEDPVATPLTHLCKSAEPCTPKTPEFEITSSLKNWLQSQKKK